MVNAGSRYDKADAKAALITMPWDLLGSPSIQLGILTRVLKGCGVDTVVYQFNRTFAEFLHDRSKGPDAPTFGVDEYDEIANGFHLAGLGEWIFSAPPFRNYTPESDDEYLKYLRRWRASSELIARSLWARAQTPAFLDLCARKVLARSPRLVGFTTTFSQNVSSLILAMIIKERSPETTVIFGGANCEGPMGEALHRQFPWVDVVVRGEGEQVLAALARQICGGDAISPVPGLCYREGGEQKVLEEAQGGSIRMDDVPVPDYDDYFSALRESALGPALWHQTRIPLRHPEAAGGARSSIARSVG